jgi:hypothetical protein
MLRGTDVMDMSSVMARGNRHQQLIQLQYYLCINVYIYIYIIYMFSTVTAGFI